MNDDSTPLWQQALLQADVQMKLKIVEQDVYQKHGRLVPEMPAENGVTLGSAILSEECMRDLVRGLRDAGWSVEVSEPDEKALYMMVVASNEETRLNMALLYSCGTNNGIYRMPVEKCEAILYRGAPYHQESSLAAFLCMLVPSWDGSLREHSSNAGITNRNCAIRRFCERI